MNVLAVSTNKNRIYDEVSGDEATGFSSDEDYSDCTGPPTSYTRKWELCKYLRNLISFFIIKVC